MGPDGRVSILVFLDLGLWLGHVLSQGRQVGSFQSLFFWIWGSGMRVVTITTTTPRFQSLFFWIWGSGTKRSGRLSRNFRCFNPCFSGSGALASIARSDISSAARFQSLFFWIWGSGPAQIREWAGQPSVSILVFLDLGLWHKW